MIKYDIISKTVVHFIILSCISLDSCMSRAEELPREPLWSLGAPEAKGDDPKNDQPAITIYSPVEDIVNGTAVVICPGGGYGFLAIGHEGRDIAIWLNSLGITGIVLEYRMSKGGYTHPLPLQDAQRAIRTVRYRAKGSS